MVKYSFRPPPLDVPVKVDADHLVRGKESVFDALLQRIRVDRLAEVVDVFLLFRPKGPFVLIAGSIGLVITHIFSEESAVFV